METVAPSRERGLKYMNCITMRKAVVCRSFTGAWIEIRQKNPVHSEAVVAPSRERGLKSNSSDIPISCGSSLLHGSVD